MSEWIKCSDMLPAFNREVLFYIPIRNDEDSNFVVGYLDYHGGFYLHDGMECIHNNEQITHWMPLPSKPGVE